VALPAQWTFPSANRLSFEPVEAQGPVYTGGVDQS